MNFDLILGDQAGLGAAGDASGDPTGLGSSGEASEDRAGLGTAAASSDSTFDSLATGWLSRDKKRRKRRRRVENEEKHLFPWVSDKWTDLRGEQKRQNKRQGRLAPCARSCVHSTLKGICTLYGAQPGMRCMICNVVHKKPKALIEKEIMEDTSGWVDGTMRANLKRERRLEAKRLKELQITRMARAADALKWRRRKREKRMQVDPGTFLNDYSDSGGGTVNPDMRKAIDLSMKNQGLSKREKRFRGKLPRRLPMLKFRPIPIRADEEPGGDFIRGLSHRKKRGKRRTRLQSLSSEKSSFKYEL